MTNGCRANLKFAPTTQFVSVELTYATAACRRSGVSGADAKFAKLPRNSQQEAPDDAGALSGLLFARSVSDERTAESVIHADKADVDALAIR
jgi:hypothetical protein